MPSVGYELWAILVLLRQQLQLFDFNTSTAVVSKYTFVIKYRKHSVKASYEKKCVQRLLLCVKDLFLSSSKPSFCKNKISEASKSSHSKRVVFPGFIFTNESEVNNFAPALFSPQILEISAAQYCFSYLWKLTFSETALILSHVDENIKVW